MKRIKIVVASFIFLLGVLTACNSNSNITDPNSQNYETDHLHDAEKISIVTTIFPQYDFTRQIVGDRADVTMLLKPGAESHSYEPTPQDIKTIQFSDLFIYTGGENDFWIEEILTSMGNDAPETLRLVDLVDTVAEEIVEGMEHEHDEHDDHEHAHQIDEHVWTSPIKAIEIVEKISEKLIQLDSANEEFFSENKDLYVDKLRDIDQQFRDLVAEGESNVILFADRFPFRYFADEYGLEYFAAFSGCSTETEASAATVAFLINKVNELNLPVVFTIEFSNEQIADSIVETTDAEKLTFHSIHNLSVEELAANETYISLMEKNLKVLEIAIN